ncbi:PREDICTED: putative fasciclin-like arabinogalactan protein 20 [Tarenaya hassleriana]|uniref:putative fasciclin-like arabinogalactan protein 20 n=1 Tax=Tarenaya hassleriana TaxID=28532 RepID=UPI00053C6158|nr:PREDICTED: putative fasciclin-like arabinogalactan protein 20 [Tarenaya hassleriana]
MVGAKLFLCSLPLYFILSVALPSHSVPDAVKTLWDSGLTGMSLVMQYGGERVTPSSEYPSLTVFAPSDAVFERFGQPSLDQIHLHYSPMRLSPETRGSLSAGTKIPTLTPNRSLIVTSSPYDGVLSLNGVKITSGSPEYDDRSLVVFEVDGFFDSEFEISDPDHGNLSCTAPFSGRFSDLREKQSFVIAAKALRSKGYAAMASFLETQIGEVADGASITVFAPIDESVIDLSFRFGEQASLFLSHVLPCKISWRELSDLEDGAELRTYMEGFTINVTRFNGGVRLNGVLLVEREVFLGERVVVHGIAGAIGTLEVKTDGLVSSGSHTRVHSGLVEFLGFWVLFVTSPVCLLVLRRGMSSFSKTEIHRSQMTECKNFPSEAR